MTAAIRRTSRFEQQGRAIAPTSRQDVLLAKARGSPRALNLLTSYIFSISWKLLEWEIVLRQGTGLGGLLARADEIDADHPTGKGPLVRPTPIKHDLDPSM